MKELEKTLKTFANKKRLEILSLLFEEPRVSLAELARAIKLSYRSTSKHLRKLYECDIVERETVRGESFYYLNQQASRHCKKILELIREQLGKKSS